MTVPPSSWALTTIGEIADLVNGRAFKPSDWSDSGLPIVRIQNLNKKDVSFNHFAGPVDERHLVRHGDLLFAWSGTPGTSFGAHVWRGPDAVLNQHIFNVRVDPALVDRDFLAGAINSTLDAQIAKSHGGAGLRHVTRSAFESTLISLPPLAEQKRIVERLRQYERRISSIMRSLDEAELAAEQGRSRLLAAAYDRDLLPPSHRSVNRSASNMVEVGDIATDISYGSSAKSAPSGEVVVLRMGNIRGGDLDWTSLAYTSNPSEIDRYRLEPGDVLFTRTNGSPQLVGKSAVYRGEQPAIHAGYLIRIRCSERMIPDYLAYCLNSPVGRAYWLAVRSDSSGLSNVNARKLAAFRLPCPSVEDQRLICDAVAAAQRRLMASDLAVAKGRDAVAAIRVDLLDAAFKGQLGTGRIEDEPAAHQLEKLKAARQKVSPRTRAKSAVAEVIVVKRTVLEVLGAAAGPLPAQEVARLCGVRADAELEDIEPFYAELRSLEKAKMLHIEAVRDADGAKLGELLGLQPAA